MADLLMLGGGSGGGTTLTGTGVARNTGACTELSGDVTTSGSNATALKSTGTAGTYTKVTTDAQGRVSSGTTLSSSDLPTNTPPTGAGFWSWYGLSAAPLNNVARTTMSIILTGGGAGGYAGYMMYIPQAITISHVTWEISTVVAGGTLDFGLYKAAGGANSLVASTGGVSTNVGGANVVTTAALTQGTVTIQPGWYYFVITSSTVTTLVMLTWTSFAATFNDPASIFNARNASAATSMLVFATGVSGGILPTTMPTWSQQLTSGAGIAPPCVYFSN